MKTSRMTSKGQVTIPVAVRSVLGLKQGDRVDFVEIDKDRFAIVPANLSVQELKGIIKKPGRPVTVEDMNVAVATRGAGR